MHGPTKKNKNAIASPAARITIRNAMATPRSDKGQRNFDKKRKPEDTVATMEQGQKGKKGNLQDDF